MKQTNREELLDLRHGTPGEVRRSLHDIRRINTYLGGAAQTVSGVLSLLNGQREATVLDIGTGAGDLPLRLQRAARQRGLALRVLGLDNQMRHLRVAQEDTRHERGIGLVGGDAFSLPLGDQSVDVVVSSLFLHHFRGPEIARLLREFDRVSRVGWVMNDLVRSLVPLAFFRVAWPVFARSYITRHDAAVSIRRAYTPEEMRHIAAQAGLPGIEVRACFPFRMSLSRRK